MKYLEMKALQKVENKMKPGTRPDQQELRRSNPTPQIKGELRQLAERYGLDVDSLTGTGANGEITREDIKKAKREHDKMMKEIQTKVSDVSALIEPDTGNTEQ